MSDTGLLAGGLVTAVFVIVAAWVGAFASLALLVAAWAWRPARWDRSMVSVVSNTGIATTLVGNLAWIVVAAWLSRAWYLERTLEHHLFLAGGSVFVVAVGVVGTAGRLMAQLKAGRETEQLPPPSREE